jgi:Nif-specific regulatory protein
METPAILGKSTAIKHLLAFINRASSTDSNILILGETGVGKDLAAKAIHCLSARKNGAFVKINCGNLSETLIESELFGYQKGAFTGAFTNKAGLIETANHGTFFFDEIADIGLSPQAKLLSVIEDRQLRRIGENSSHYVDTRFIFATNKDLSGLVSRGRFREDLYYRIFILAIRIPPLRERKEDIPLLVEAIIDKENQKRSNYFTITDEAMNKIIKHSFPGNVRELENIIIRAIDLSGGNKIRDSDISFQRVLQKGELINKERRTKIMNILVKCKGNKTAVARELGISRVHLYRLLKADKIEYS